LKSLTKAKTHQLDVTSTSSIDAFKKELRDESIDLLLNVAGIMASPDKDGLETTSLSVLEKTFAVNTFGPLLLTQALLPNLLKSSSPKICIVSSRVGSIADNSSGGSYAYRASKAAVNSIGKSLAMDLKSKNVPVLLLHPGIVKSNLMPGVSMPAEAVMPDEAAKKLWENVVKVKGMESTGTFWHREGFELDW
jgi:NAD(P)-dependent dehydrogenase (short-subunit alcohol dehydrogenase family)